MEEVMSARRPKAKQIVEMAMPIIVRNWRCQPYEELCILLACARVGMITIARYLGSLRCFSTSSTHKLVRIVVQTSCDVSVVQMVFED